MSEVYEDGKVTLDAEMYRKLLGVVETMREEVELYRQAAANPGTDRGGTSVATQLVHCQRKRAEAEAALNTVQDERAASFERLAAAVGGVGLTPYQPEIDIVIEARIVALQKGLHVGDRMYWSTELLRGAIATDAHLVLTRCVRVDQNPDGTKTVVMEKVGP